MQRITVTDAARQIGCDADTLRRGKMFAGIPTRTIGKAGDRRYNAHDVRKAARLYYEYKKIGEQQRRLDARKQEIREQMSDPATYKKA